MQRETILFIILLYTSLTSFAQKAKRNSKDGLYYDSSGKLFSGVIYEPPQPDTDSLPPQDSAVITCENGKLIILKEYNEDGTLNLEYYNYTEGIWIQYYKNGRIWILRHYKNGKQEGNEIEWHENGNIKSISNYKDDKINGIFESYYEDGKIDSRSNFVNGERVGDWLRWYPNGQLMYEEHNIRIQGVKSELREYYDTGALRVQWIFDDIEDWGHFKSYRLLYYNESGKLYEEEIHKGGSLIETRIYESDVKYKIKKEK